MKLNPTINWSALAARLNYLAGLVTTGGLVTHYIPPKYAAAVMLIALTVQGLTDNMSKPSGIVRPIE